LTNLWKERTLRLKYKITYFISYKKKNKTNCWKWFKKILFFRKIKNINFCS